MDFTGLKIAALQKAAKQDELASFLDLSPSQLSKRLNGEVGWQEKDLNKLLKFVAVEILDCGESDKKIDILKKALKISLE